MTSQLLSSPPLDRHQAVMRQTCLCHRCTGCLWYPKMLQPDVKRGVKLQR